MSFHSSGNLTKTHTLPKVQFYMQNKHSKWLSVASCDSQTAAVFQLYAESVTMKTDPGSQLRPIKTCHQDSTPQLVTGYLENVHHSLPSSRQEDEHMTGWVVRSVLSACAAVLFHFPHSGCVLYCWYHSRHSGTSTRVLRSLLIGLPSAVVSALFLIGLEVGWEGAFAHYLVSAGTGWKATSS